MRKSDNPTGRKPGQPREVWLEIFLIYGALLAALIWNWW